MRPLLIAFLLLFAGCAEPTELEPVSNGGQNSEAFGENTLAEDTPTPLHGKASGTINQIWLSNDIPVGEGENCFSLADVESMTGLTLELWINLTTADAFGVRLVIGDQDASNEVGVEHIKRTESFVTGDGIQFSFHPTAAPGVHGDYNLIWHAEDYEGPENPVVTPSACNN